jgi:hypothetical protein
MTDVEFGSEGANANTGTSATFNGTTSIIQHDWSTDLNPESFTLTLWARSRQPRVSDLRQRSLWCLDLLERQRRCRRQLANPEWPGSHPGRVGAHCHHLRQ